MSLSHQLLMFLSLPLPSSLKPIKTYTKKEKALYTRQSLFSVFLCIKLQVDAIVQLTNDVIETWRS